MIRLTTADRRLVASADDTPGLFTDGYLTAVLPEDGEYVLEFCDSRFAGTGRAVYRLLIGAVPFAGEVYPLSLPRGQNTALELRGGTLSGDRLFALRTPSDPLLAMFYSHDPRPIARRSRLGGFRAGRGAALAGPAGRPRSPSTSRPILRRSSHRSSPPVTILGRLSKAGERDEFTITAPPGSKHEVRVEAWGLGSALDGQLRVFDKDGRLLGESRRRQGHRRASRRRRWWSCPRPGLDRPDVRPDDARGPGRGQARGQGPDGPRRRRLHLPRGRHAGRDRRSSSPSTTSRSPSPAAARR